MFSLRTPMKSMKKLKTSSKYTTPPSRENYEGNTPLQEEKNRNCCPEGEDTCRDLGQCTSLILEGDPHYIGSGTYGIIFKMSWNKNEDIAIKFMFDFSSQGEKFHKLMNEEVSYSYSMSDKEIGPKVYDAFYYSISSDKIKKLGELHNIISLGQNIKLEHFKSYKPGTTVNIQCIVMKAYKQNCYTALGSDLNDSIKLDIIRKMVKLVRTQIDEGMYCFDVKPQNYVVNYKKHLDVKMIDFSPKYCIERNIYPDRDNSDKVYPKDLGMNITYLDLLYISNIIQIYVIIVQNIEKFEKLYIDRRILEAFFGDPIFRNFFSGHWKTLINWYILIYAKKTFYVHYNPSNTLVWYTFNYNFPPSIKSDSKKNKYLYSPGVLKGISDTIINILERARIQLEY